MKTPALLFSTLIIITGCSPLANRLEQHMDANAREIDLSQDDRYGYIVGKEFELNKNLELYRYADSEMYHLGSLTVYVEDENGNPVIGNDPRFTPFREDVKRGTRFVICRVSARKDSFSLYMGCIPRLYTMVLDSQGNEVIADVSDLFKYEPEYDECFTSRAAVREVL